MNPVVLSKFNNPLHFFLRGYTPLMIEMTKTTKNREDAIPGANKLRISNAVESVFNVKNEYITEMVAIRTDRKEIANAVFLPTFICTGPISK